MVVVCSFAATSSCHVVIKKQEVKRNVLFMNPTVSSNNKYIFMLNLDTVDDVKQLKEYIPYFNYMEENFFKFAKFLDFPLSIFVETRYVDKTYRDTYYFYFSSKHFFVEKNCQRISLFTGIWKTEDFYDKAKHANLSKSFIGTVVIKPLAIGTWGKTLIDPRKIHSETFYVRTATYNIIINGVEFNIRAFPFSSQDTETMTCAETSIWAMLDYYGNKYPEYRTVLPSEIALEVNLSSDERSLPSRGLTYLQKSNLLKKFGFSPRVYDKKVYYEEKSLKRLFHYYVESGIPSTLSLQGHSTVCIGHAESTVDVKNVQSTKTRGIDFIDSADLFERYVIIDDNQIPYVVEQYDSFSIHDYSKELLRFTVPLYKRIILEATDAQKIFEKILDSICQNPFINSRFNTHNISDNNPVVKRIFLTSSRKYKYHRIQQASRGSESFIYSNIPFPKFLWVMELSDYNSYSNKQVFGEIVLDATSSRYSKFNSLILLRLDNHLAYRFPHETFHDLFKRFAIELPIGTSIKQYTNNLLIGGEQNDNSTYSVFPRKSTP